MVNFIRVFSIKYKYSRAIKGKIDFFFGRFPFVLYICDIFTGFYSTLYKHKINIMEIKKSKNWICLLLALFGVMISCTNKQPTDPFEIIEQVANEVSEHSEEWEKEEWDAAADKVLEALEKLPSPLETSELIQLSSDCSMMRVSSTLHERKAAKMIEVLDKLNDIISGSRKSLDGDKEDELDTGELPRESVFSGLIDNQYPVTMHLVRNGDAGVNGDYFYDKNGPNNKLMLVGNISMSDIDLEEYNNDNVQTGRFQGKFESGYFNGTFSTPDGRSMPFNLQLTQGYGKTAGNGSSDEYSDDYNGYSHNSNLSSNSPKSYQKSNSFDNDNFLDEDAAEEYINELQSQLEDERKKYEDEDMDIDKWLDEYLDYLNEYEKWLPAYHKKDPVAISKISQLAKQGRKHTIRGGKMGHYFARHSPTPSQAKKWQIISEKVEKMMKESGIESLR